MRLCRRPLMLSHQALLSQRWLRGVGGARIPSLDKRDMLAFVALQAVARACGEAKRERRAILQPLLATLAVECASSVGWSAEQLQKAAAEDRSRTSRGLFSQER